MRFLIIAAATIVSAIIGFRWLTNVAVSQAADEVAPADWIPKPERNLTVYIGWPLAQPKEWKKAKSYDQTRLELVDGTIVAPQDVRSHLLVYPNQEILSAQGIFQPLPAGLKMLMKVKTPTDTGALDPAEVALSRKGLSGDSRSDTKTLRRCFDLRHVAEESHDGADPNSKVRRLLATRRVLCMTTVSGDFFSAEQFAAWYATAKDGWIAPGGSAVDENNYYGGGIWAYYGETKDGKQFIAVAPCPQ